MGTRMTKDVGLRIRVDEKLRKDFVSACKSQDLTASQVLRAFMRQYVNEILPTANQPDLFSFLKRANMDAQ